MSRDVADSATSVDRGEPRVRYGRSVSKVSHPEHYQQWYRSVEDNSYWFRHRANCIIACLKQFPPDQPLFDVGGGNGHVTMAMQNAGYETVLLEPSQDAVANAQHRGLKNIVCSTLEEADIPANSVGTIGLFDVLEHIDDDRGFLRRIRRMLHSRGRLFLTVPAFGFLWSWHDKEVGHFRRYSLSQLEARLRQTGFEIELASYLFAPLPLPIFLLRSLPWRMKLAKQSSRRHFQREHAAQGGLAYRTVEMLLRREIKRLSRGKPIRVGSSCLAVARAA